MYVAIRLGVLLFLLLSTVAPSFAAVVLSERDWQTLKALARGGMCGVRTLSSFPYAVVVTDRDCVLLVNSASAVDITLPQAGTNGITAGFSFSIINLGAGVVTVIPATSLIQSSPDYDVASNSSASITTDGTNYFVLAGAASATTPGLDAVFDVQNIIDGATSARPFKPGDGTRGYEIFGDATLGSVIRPFPLGDSLWRCWTNFNCLIRDEEGNATILTIDPDAASKNAMYQFGANYRPLKSVWIGAGNLYGDGTNCPERPTAVTINSGPKIPTFICADNNGSRLTGMLRMPNDWDGGTITLTHSYIQTAADTSQLNGDAAAQCRGHGETVSSTWGTEVAIDDSNVTGSNANDLTTSGAITPAGTCAAGDMLYFYYELDAAGTTTPTATLHHLGFHLTYSSTSLSH